MSTQTECINADLAAALESMGVLFSVEYLRCASSTDICPSGFVWTAHFSKTSARTAFTFCTGSAWVKDGAPTPPSAADVLTCVLIDAQAEHSTFQEWAADLGYPLDNAARVTYNACRRNANKLHRIFSTEELETLCDILQEY